MTQGAGVPGHRQPPGAGDGIYMDHQAATPMDPRVVEAMVAAMTEIFGNANSTGNLHGEAAAAALRDAKSVVAELVGSTADRVRFTSGSTEALRLAVSIAARSMDGRVLRVAVARTEHRALLAALDDAVRSGMAVVRWLQVDHRARVAFADLDAALAEGQDLVCMMAANNEVGTIYPVAEAARMARRAGARILVDATQAVGRAPLDADGAGYDFVVFNAHKIYGPKGIGALVGEAACSAIADQVAGHAGTPDVPAAVGFAAACRIILYAGVEDDVRIAARRDRMERILRDRIPDIAISGDLENRLSCNLHFAVPGIPGDAVMARLRGRVSLSTGSACNSGAQEPSHVLVAMGFSEDMLEGALRVSPGRFTTDEEADRAASLIADAIAAVGATLRETDR